MSLEGRKKLKRGVPTECYPFPGYRGPIRVAIRREIDDVGHNTKVRIRFALEL